jgi:hypothetical protein
LKAKVDRKEYFYLSPKTAYFLKTNHSEWSPREKDVHDMKILEELL